ncbi:MAG: class I SAM-dependent methyltransferase [Thermoanaerobaculia bacterium]
MSECDEFRYASAGPSHTNAYVNGPVFELIAKDQRSRAVRRVFELGCGSGAFASELARRGFEVTAVDVSMSGIEQARAAYLGPSFEVASAYDELSAKYGQFDLVISLEVVEHLYSPRKWAANLRELLTPGGLAIVSTPYHDYFKNLAISLAGRWDSHMNPLWDHGHIKLWSARSLTRLLEEVGLTVERIERVGRVPIFAKSMVIAARRP